MSLQPRSTQAVDWIRPRQEPAKARVLGLVVVLFFTGLMFMALWENVTRRVDMVNITIILVVVVVLFAMAASLVRALLDHHRHGRVVLELRGPWPEAGGRLSARISLPDSDAGARIARVECWGVRDGFVRHHGSWIRERKDLWRSKTQFPVRSRQVDLAFDIPAELPGSTLEVQPARGGAPVVRWRLSVILDVPGDDRARTFDVPVLPQGGREHDVLAAHTAPGGSAPVIVLVLANLVPLGGVLFAGWKVFDVVLLFWLENLVIGAVNILRITTCQAPFGDTPDPVHGSAPLVERLGLAVFFALHYGLFCLVHGFLLVALLGKGAVGVSDDALILQDPFTVAAANLQADSALAVAFLCLVASHLFSFFRNYIVRGENRNQAPARLMVQPYGRVLVVHFFVLVGALAAVYLGGDTAFTALFVIIKIVVDLVSHQAERRALSARG